MGKHWRLASLALVFTISVLAQPSQQAPAAKLELKVLPRATITVLVDNLAGGGPVLGEWGASFLIETEGHRILVDTGGGRTLAGNARALDVDLAKIDAVVISHEHLDHTGGLEAVLASGGSVGLFVHPAGFETRYWKHDGRAMPHRLPLSRQQLGERGCKLVETKEPTIVREGVMVSGQIPRVTDFEDTGIVGAAFLEEGLKTPDPVQDDQAVFFRVPEGLVIVLGCAHAGLVNTMRYVSELTGERRIHAIIGGAHLVGASPARVRKTIEALKTYDVQKIMLSHCTGLQAYTELATALPGRCSWPASGATIEFGKR